MASSNANRRQWFEFLLDENLLVEHVQQPQADPGPWELCLVLLATNNNDTPEKVLKKKILALRIVALSSWDLTKLMSELPVHMQQILLSEFCALTKTPNNDHTGSAHEIFAYALYCRWVLRYVFKAQVPVRGHRGLVVSLPGQTDPTYVAPETLERIEKSLMEESDQCAQWLQDFLKRPVAKMATHDCFSMKSPHFIDSRGVTAVQSLLIAEVSLDLGSYLFFKERYNEARDLIMTAKKLLPRDHSMFKIIEGLVANYEDQGESTDEEMDNEDDDIIRRIDQALNENNSKDSKIKSIGVQASAETRLLVSQDANEILSLAEQVPNGHTLNSNWQILPPHLQSIAKNPAIHIILAKAIELRRLKKFSQCSLLLKHLVKVFPKADRLQWELAYNSIIEGVNVLPSVELILSAQRSPDMPVGMINTALIELVNEEQYQLVAVQDIRGHVMSVTRPLANCCATKQPISGMTLWKAVVGFLLVKRNRTDSDGCQALIFIISRLKNNLAKGILISLFAHLYNILRDDSNSSLFHEYSSFWPASLQDASHYCLETCAHLLQSCLHGARSPHWLKTHADLSFDQNYYSVALKHYIETLVSVTNFFTEQCSIPGLVDDTLYRRMAQCCARLSCHTQAAILFQFMAVPDYAATFKCLNDKSCNDSCDSLYKYIWDSNILEFLANLHTRRGEVEAKKAVLSHMSMLELNSNNPKRILEEAAARRKCAFLRTLAKQYFL